MHAIRLKFSQYYSVWQILPCFKIEVRKIDTIYQFIRECIDKNKVQLEFVMLHDQGFRYTHQATQIRHYLQMLALE